MLVVPHQFNAPAYRTFQPHLTWWGTLLLSAGAALMTIAALLPRRIVVVVAHTIAGLALLFLGYGFVATRSWTGTVVYATLGLGCVLAPFLPQRPSAAPETRSPDLFAFVMGSSALLNGMLMLALPDAFNAALYDVLRPYLLPCGIVFLLGGAVLVTAHLVPSVSVGVLRIAHLVTAAAFLIFVLLVSLPNVAWIGIAFYGGFGIVLAVLPWLSARRPTMEPRSLQTSLALVLAAAASLPLIVTTALVTHQQERLATEQALSAQRALTTALAQDVTDYVGLHRGVVATLAAYPGLLDLSPAAQHQLLQAANAAYPATYALTIVDATGAMRARSDNRPLQTIANLRVFQDAAGTNQASFEIVAAESLPQPIFAFSAPIHTTDGGFAGVVASGLDVSHLATLLAHAGRGVDAEVYLVDPTGRVIAHPDPQVTRLMNRSTLPSVATFLHQTSDSGSLSYITPTGTQLAAYARLPELGWGVVVERPRAEALAPTRAGREITFGVLLLAIGLSAGIGVVAAHTLTASLSSLAHAVAQLPDAPSAVELPSTRIHEIAQLTQVFNIMRQRLMARTAERARAEQSLRFLAEASTELARSLEYDTTLQRVTQLAVSGIADWCSVDLRADDGSIQRAAVAAIDPATKEVVDVRQCRALLDPALLPPSVQVMETRQALHSTALSNAQLHAWVQDTEQFAVLRQGNPHSGICVPLLARGRTLGALTLIMAESRRADMTTNLHVVEELARRAAIALDNALLYREVQEALHAREVFFSIASHELKTPITSLLGYAELLQRRHARANDLVPRDQRALAVIVQQAVRLNTLVAALLDLSRIETGQLTLHTHDLDLAALVERVIEEFQPTLTTHALIFQHDPGPWIMQGDSVRLEQVVYNLLQNAVKYSPHGGLVRVSLTHDAAHICLAVQDQGIGIPETAQAQIFHRFYRAPNVDPQQISGLGIGLFIIKDIVMQHGGTITVTSTEGVGSTFTVCWPLMQPTLEDGTVEQGTARHSDAYQDGE
ncbi:MAG TPA: ATP-binding protein [Herpetosiphonaceae bacterium]